MKFIVTFTLQCSIEGEPVPRDEVAIAIQEWAEDFEFGDAIIDYVNEEYGIDHFEATAEHIEVRA